MSYSSQLMTYFDNMNHAVSDDFNDFTHQAMMGSKTNRDQLVLCFSVNKGVIKSAHFRAYGAVVLYAAAEYICQYAENRSVDDLLSMDTQYMLEVLGLSSYYQHIVLLVLNTVKRALLNNSSELNSKI